MCKKILLFLFLGLIGANLTAQISINTTNADPDASAMLDINSSQKGLLIPRMTSTERLAIPSPADGLLVYDNTTNSFWYYNGTIWLDINDAGQDEDWLRTNGATPTSIGNSIYTNGNVGFGTPSPSFPIDVQGTGGERIRSYTKDGFYAGLLAKNNTREFFMGVQATFETNDASSGFHIYDNTAGSQRMVIDKDGDIGINQTNPNAKLHVNGDVRIVDGTQGVGKILTSDAAGFATWQTPTDNVNDADADPTNEIELPSGGTAGQFLTTDGMGTVAWDTPTDNVNDADADPTNEIELPSGGTAGQFLKTDGMGTVAWDTPTDNVNDADADATNELQTLSLTGTKLSISEKDTVNFNTLFDTLSSKEAKVNGTIFAQAQSDLLKNTSLDGREGIVMPGGTSDYIISTQDGNGRVQHKWNATYGVNETFVVAGEDAAFIDMNVTAAGDNSPWIEFKHADGVAAMAGDPISWHTQMIINQGGAVGINELSPDDLLHVTSAGNGTRVRTENTGNGWAGLVAKNTQREMFLGVQGAFDANPGEFHIYDNTAGARRMVIDATGEIGIGRNNPSVKLDVNGAVNCTGGTCSSDIRWKKDILPLTNTLSKIQQLRGVSYYWRTNEFPDRDFNTSKQIGVIAQEVENVFPELVKTDNEGYKSMDYMSLTAVLLEAMKEQQAQIEQLKADKADLKTDVELLKAAVFGKNVVEENQQEGMPKSFVKDK